MRFECKYRMQIFKYFQTHMLEIYANKSSCILNLFVKRQTKQEETIHRETTILYRNSFASRVCSSLETLTICYKKKNDTFLIILN